MFKSLIFASLLAAGSAHQNFHQFWVNDVSPGFEVGIRMPPSNSPVVDVASNDIVCNVPGTNAPAGGVATVDVAAGDKITVQWDQSTHPGPITHMLFGPIPSAALASGVGEWAKIDELNAVDGKWANEIMSAVDMKHSFNLPANLASGEYLLRSEMLALHGASTVGGAQFYIGCAQIKVTGPGGSCGAKITLPGAYDANEAAILIPNLYNGFSPDNYTAPGGPVAVCAAGAGGSSPTTLATTTRAATSSAVVSSTVAAVPTSAAASASSSVAAPVESSSSIAAPIPTSSSIPTTSAAALPSTTASPSKTACKSKTTVPTLAPSSSVAPSKSACKPKSSSSIAAVPTAASASVSSVAAAPSASSTGVSTVVSFYGQCGGVNYSGSTVCAEGSTCVKSNDWYSQCVRS